MNIYFTHFSFFVITSLIKIIIVVVAALHIVPFTVWWERKLIAWVQHRDGPTKVGPFGLLQTLVDGAKLFLKEDIRPGVVEAPLHAMAPGLTAVVALFALAILPFGPIIRFDPTPINALGLHLTFEPGTFELPLGITDLPIGILAYMAITGVGVYGIVLAGWASNSKYALLGGIRSSAQMLSYEIALGLSIVGVLLITGTFNLREIIDHQSSSILAWNIFKQPIAFLLFLVAGFAETNRLPFDLPEGESELGAGFHTEYSSMKFALFFLSEYLNMYTSMTILCVLFLGGYMAPFPQLMAGHPGSVAYAISALFWLAAKLFCFITFMIFIRAVLPRLRYDQLMDFGWKLLFPLALINLVVTAVLIGFLYSVGAPATHGLVTTILFIVGVAEIIITDTYLTRKKRRFINAARPV